MKANWAFHKATFFIPFNENFLIHYNIFHNFLDILDQ